MTQLIGVQELYAGCFGVGFLLTAGSLVFSGGKSKGGRGGGRAGGRGAIRGGSAKAPVGRAAPRVNIANAKAGVAPKLGGRGAPKVAARVAAKGAAKVAAKGAGKTAAKGGTTRGGKGGNTADGAAGQLAHVEGAASTDPIYVNTTHGAESDNQYLEQVFFFLMGIINPMSIALLIFFFGATGLAILRYFPSMAPEYWPAGIGALLCSSLSQNLLSWFAAKVENPELHLVDQVVGSIGEISVSINPGKLGEIVFVLGEGRKNYPAKAMDPNKQIKRGTKVLIIQFEDNVAWVEAEDDLYFDADDAHISEPSSEVPIEQTQTQH